MNVVLYFLFFLGLIATLVRCGSNEQFKSGLSCIETCTSKPQPCPMTNKTGCFCKNGYVRESDAAGSPCIKHEQCKPSKVTPTCLENEEYTTCGSTCAPTCDDLHYPVPKPPKSCSLICLSGCFCKKGFYRSDDGKCVVPEQCCGKSERYQVCGTACVETCNKKPTICTEQCVAGCFCGCSDYVRQSDKTDSPCIPRDECPKGCAETD